MGMYIDIFTEFPPSYDGFFFYLFAGLLVKETIFKKSTSKYFSIGAIINKCWGILYIFFSHLLVGNNFEIPTCYHGYC